MKKSWMNHKHFYRKLKPKLPLKGCLTSNIKYVQYFGYTHHISSILNVTVKMWRAHVNTKGHANKQDILPGSKICTLMFRFIVGLRTSRWERKISKKKSVNENREIWSKMIFLVMQDLVRHYAKRLALFMWNYVGFQCNRIFNVSPNVM